MRVAAIYDIHGNVPALEAVLDDIRELGVDRIVIGGDVVPGPMSREVIGALERLPVPCHFLRGNGENDVLATRGGETVDRVPESVRGILRWVGESLAAEEATWLADWPATVRLGIAGLGDVLFCHATPRSDDEIFTRLTPEDALLPMFEGADAGVVVCGHTHMPFDRRVGAVRVVNPGSVGMPFGEPGAHWALLGPSMVLRRTTYDLEAAAARIRATDYPEAEGFAAGHVLAPPSEEEMLALFEGATRRSGGP